MPIKTIFESEIKHVSILDEDAVFDEELGKGLIPDDDLVKLYEHLGVCRHFDEIAFKLQRSGRMGTYPENRGQEAVSVGAAYALNRDDWFVTCYRENTGLAWHGLPLEYVLLHWMGDERGNEIPEGVNCTPLAIPIGTQMLHAVGLAWAAKYKGQSNIACTFFGDGATSEGDFHEAANFAATLDIPCIFVCQNNGWAISVPTARQCSAPTLAQRGIAYGMDVIQVDGNDLFAMVKVTRDAAERAREKKRPTFIEALTYRLGDHTTADDARRYRDADEVATWEKRDPMIRLRKHLNARGLWDDKKETALQKRAKKEVAAIVERAEGIEPFDDSDFFNHIFAEIPDDLRQQRDTKRTSSLGRNPESSERSGDPSGSPELSPDRDPHPSARH